MGLESEYGRHGDAPKSASFISKPSESLQHGREPSHMVSTKACIKASERTSVICLETPKKFRDLIRSTTPLPRYYQSKNKQRSAKVETETSDSDLDFVPRSRSRSDFRQGSRPHSNDRDQTRQGTYIGMRKNENGAAQTERTGKHHENVLRIPNDSDRIPRSTEQQEQCRHS